MQGGRYVNIFLIPWSFSFKKYSRYLLAWVWLSLELDLAGCKRGGGEEAATCAL